MRFKTRIAYGDWPYDIVVMAIDEDEQIVAASSARVFEGKRLVEIHGPVGGDGGTCSILSNGRCELYEVSAAEVEEEYPGHMDEEHQAAYLFGLLAQNLPVDFVAKIVQFPQPA